MTRQRTLRPLLPEKRCTRSGPNECVEVLIDRQDIFVRDSKDQLGTALRFTPVEREAFIGGVRAGEFEVRGGVAIVASHDSPPLTVRSAGAPSHRSTYPEHPSTAVGPAACATVLQGAPRGMAPSLRSTHAASIQRSCRDSFGRGRPRRCDRESRTQPYRIRPNNHTSLDRLVVHRGPQGR